MKRSWKSLAKQFNQLKLSERRLMVITSVVVILVMFSMLVWEPLIESWGKRTKELRNVSQQIKTIDESIVQLMEAAKNDPNDALRKELKSLIDQVQIQQSKIESITSALITPEKMTGVFEQLLSNGSIKINSIENKPAVGVEMPGQKTEAALLYEHSLRLEMEGSYGAVLNYVNALESQNWTLYWDDLIYRTTKYPSGILTLEVHTLSTSEHVLGF